jgi:hypothetical protein
MLRKLLMHGKPVQWQILKKEVVDEMIFRTENTRYVSLGESEALKLYTIENPSIL